MRRILSFVILLLWATSASSQMSEEEFLRYKIDNHYEREESIAGDTLLFYRLSQQYYDSFNAQSAYSFSFVGFARRGLEYSEQPTLLDGVALPSSVLSVVRRLGIEERYFGGLAHGEQTTGGVGGTHEFSMLDGVPLSGSSVGLFFSGKGSLGGVRASVSQSMPRGWGFTAYLSARGGNDLYVKGVYNDAVEGGVRLTKDFDGGGLLSLLCAAKVGARGLRTGSTDEAFTLLGDKLYNPLWGRQQGEVRNSRVRREAVPFLAAAYADRLNDHTSFTIAVGGEWGLNRFSTLSWYDAMTPRPDNYRYMPSYFDNAVVRQAVEEQWRQGNEEYTQINWSDIYQANRLSSNGAVYTLDDNVERGLRGELSAMFKTILSPSLTVAYGLRGRVKSSRHYKQMRDALGTDYLVDLDYYLLDDDSFSNNLQNNLRSPDRRVGQGDRYAYDYALREQKIMAECHFEWRVERWRVRFDAEVGSEALWRRGYYEKQLFAGEQSYGRSAKARFTPYTLKLSANYLHSLHHILRVGAMVGQRAPYVGNIFLNPQYNNRLANNLSAERLFGVEVDYRYSSPKLIATATVYVNSITSRRQLFRSYDDLSGLYCDVDVEGIGTMSYGVEMTAVVPLSRYLKASVAAAAGRYIYSHNPVVTHYSDTDNSIVSLRSESLMGDCYVGGTPQLLALASIDYLNYKGWAASCSVQFAALRYVEASFVRRTERVLRQAAASQQIYEEFVHQADLNNAVSVDVSLSRWFRVGQGRMSLTLAVKNLLGSRDIVQYAYEPSRLRNYISGAQRIYKPHANILTYAYPRNIYGVVSWKF